MPKFGKASLQRLATCHPDLQKVLKEAIKYYDFAVIEGYRTKEEQARKVEQGVSKTMNSKHLLRYCPEYDAQYSFAVDVLPYFKDAPHTDWSDREEFCVLAGLICGIAKIYKAQGAIEHNIRWGGNWGFGKRIKDNEFFDGPHFELVD